LCTQYCPEANTIQYNTELGKDKGFKYGSAYVAVDRCKGCAQCVWVCDNMAKHKAIKMEMIDQIGDQAMTTNISYHEKNTNAVLASPWQS
jgi:Pyruvate/2-oxoacid:ferredoxin oxidoreductase delta subunit